MLLGQKKRQIDGDEEKNSGDTNCPSETEGNHVKYPRQGGRLGKTEL